MYILYLIVLFIVLTPGLLFTIPPLGKKLFGGLSGKVVTAFLHGLLFAALARFFVLYNEGFEWWTNTTSCPAGQGATYGPLGWRQHCEQCPTHTQRIYSGGHTTVSHICADKCTPGRTLNYGYNACENCPIGATSAGGDDACTPCRPGTISVMGHPLCKRCPAGTWAPTPQNVGSLPYECRACPDGHISTSAGSQSCTPCAANTTHNADRTKCVALTGLQLAAQQFAPLAAGGAAANAARPQPPPRTTSPRQLVR